MTQLTDMVYKYASSLFFCVVYEIQSGLYFGELTIFPGGGFEEFIPESWEYTLEGDISGRDTIYSALFYEWVHADSYWNYIFGLGFLSSIEIAGNFAHNDWLEMLTSFGLVGVAILIGLQYSVAKEIKNQFIPSDERWCISMIFSIIFFKMIFSMCVAETFATVTILILLGYILGSSSLDSSNKNCNNYKMYLS